MARKMTKIGFDGRSLKVISLENDNLGEVIVDLKVGDVWYHTNQMKPYVVERANRSTAVLVKYDSYGDVLDKCFLKNGSEGLWATTSGSARNGLFHRAKCSMEITERINKALSQTDRYLSGISYVDEFDIVMHTPERGGVGDHESYLVTNSQNYKVLRDTDDYPRTTELASFDGSWILLDDKREGRSHTCLLVKSGNSIDSALVESIEKALSRPEGKKGFWAPWMAWKDAIDLALNKKYAR